MLNNLDTGRQGEVLALRYYRDRGFFLLEQNWRSGHAEIDLIVARGGMLHFVEVKTRRSAVFGHPEEGVDRSKLRTVMKGAVSYLDLHPQWKRVQYDVLSVLLPEEGEPVFFLIEDVYLYR